MKRLKEIRVAKGLTQAQLAKQIGTTQQTVARWEAGSSTPSVQSLDSLAYALSTTISHLLGQRPSPTQNAEVQAEEEPGVFWGHLGLLYPNWINTQWYPITDRTYSRLWSSVRNLDDDDGGDSWLLCETLNNRMLAFRPDQAVRIWLLDDDCDGPDGDWNSKFELDDYAGHPMAIYKAMDEWVDGAWGIEEGDEESNDRQKIVEQLIKKAELDDPDKLNAFLHDTKICLIDGKRVDTWIEPDILWQSMSDLELGYARVFYAPGFGGDHESFFPVRNLAVVDAPLLDVLEGQARELAELKRAEAEDPPAEAGSTTS